MEKETLQKEYHYALQMLEQLNPEITGDRVSGGQDAPKRRPHVLQKVLIANRGEIAKRFFLALHEEGIPSVAVVTDPDKGQSWYEFADEVVFIGAQDRYTNIPVIIAAAGLVNANAIYGGYGFLSENAEFVEAIDAVSELTGNELIFMGPTAQTMHVMGDKVSSRNLALEHGIPVFESSEAIETADIDLSKKEAQRIGYPVILKLSAGGGGKGMYAVWNESEMDSAVESCCRIGRDLYQNSCFYIEKFIEKPVHIEVQVFNEWAIALRKCAVQRKNQKIIEESGHVFLKDYMALALLSAAERLVIATGYDKCGAGTVEFLIDTATGTFGFMEMNTRLQVEYGVTDQSVNIDLVKWLILYFDGREDEIGEMDVVKFRVAEKKHALECRIYAEEPENEYRPSPGVIQEINIPTFNGIRCDFGFGVGDAVLSTYDPMIGKLIAWGADREEALIRMERALQELYIKGVRTNLNQLIRIVRHPAFINPDYTNNVIPENPELNFQEPEIDEQPDMDPNTNQQILFGAFAEYMKLLHQTVREFMALAPVKGVGDPGADAHVPFRYFIKYQEQHYVVEFLQTALDSFHVYINEIYSGKIVLNAFNDRSDDFLVTYRGRSHRIRVDRRIDCLVLRMRDALNKIKYYHMTVLPEGLDEADSSGIVSSPFQGSFVSFIKNDIKVGDSVKAGEPLIILSAMKMETTMVSSIDGTISYIIEDGDQSRLQISKTLDGRIIGKSMQEGEVLLKIEPKPQHEEDAEEALPDLDLRSTYPVTHETLDMLNRENFDELILQDIDTHLGTLVELAHASILGFVRLHVIDKLTTIFDNISLKMWMWSDDLMTASRTEKINATLLHYVYITRLLSPAIASEDVPFPEELQYFVQQWQNPEATFSTSFSALMKDVFLSYGIDNWTAGTFVKRIQIQHVFWCLNRSYQFCNDHWLAIREHVHMLSALTASPDATRVTWETLLERTQTNLEDPSFTFIRKVIAEHLAERGLEESRDDKRTQATPQENEDAKSLRKTYAAWLEYPEKSLIPEDKPDWIMTRVEEKLSVLKQEYSIQRLATKFANVIVYRLESQDERGIDRYAGFSFVDCEGSEAYTEKVMEAVQQVTLCISAYQSVDDLEENWVEIIIHGKTMLWDAEKNEPESWELQELKQSCSPALGLLNGRPIAWGIIEVDVFYPFTQTSKNKHIMFYQKNARIILDMLHTTDKRNPYCLQEAVNPADQRLFENDKWPIEVWAELCFDPDSLEEITIPSLDHDSSEQRPVGSRIYVGAINGVKACFYMKDYRILGGATGDREGLKYFAATYLSYMQGWPLYVWNDGAGANIKQGVVALNRGAEGFTMNALLAERVDMTTFQQYMSHTADPGIQALMKELDAQFHISAPASTREGNSIVVTVGIGASAGLDVYGSSQATIQIMLDSEVSYRVLTGSNVIKSVMGEDITNYEIGGAIVLGEATGIVDMIAPDKIKLISDVHKLHRMFCTDRQLPGIQRERISLPAATDGDTPQYDVLVFSESVLRQNVDHGEFLPFKKQYYGSNTLIAGFTKIAGRRTLLMGPRTNGGLSSPPSIIKAQELLNMACRTASSQILIFGKQWQQIPRYGNMNIRPWLDFMDTLRKTSGVRIHIITHIDGLTCVDMNSTADVIIFIEEKDMSASDRSFAEKNATVILDSFEAAFDLSAKLIELLDPLDVAVTASTCSGVPDIPADKGEPFEIIRSVIEPVFDDESFVEFYQEMNQPSGPNLITGLAQINGRTVGIIADQPEIKGGAADAPGAEKFRVFTQLVNKHRIPLVMLSNSSGFVPGSQQERLRIQAIGAKSLDVNILSTIPVVSVVLNQVYGGRQIHAFSKYLRPGIVSIAHENACIAVMGENSAFDLLGRKKYQKFLDANQPEEAETLRRTFVEQFLEKAKASNDASNTGVLDWTFSDVKDLREHLIKGLELACQRSDETFHTE